MARRKASWEGFPAGLAAGAGAVLTSLLAWRAFGRGRKSRVLRLEKSLQIGRPVHEVFAAWSDLERLPQMSELIEQVQVDGNRSHWRVRVEGVTREWDAEVTQRIPNQALGWKSVRGPKHSGRISFSPLGDDTLLQVTMNYAPPLRLFRRAMSPMTGPLEGYLEKALRDFKAALEGKGQQSRIEERATGTYGESGYAGQQTSRYGGPPSPVEYTRPPEKPGP